MPASLSDGSRIEFLRTTGEQNLPVASKAADKPKLRRKRWLTRRWQQSRVTRCEIGGKARPPLDAGDVERTRQSGHQSGPQTEEGSLVVRKNSIRLPSDRDAGTYLFGFPALGNPINQRRGRKILLSRTDAVPS